MRRIVITLYPSGIIGLRLERTRQEERLPLRLAYETAVRARVAFERAQKARRKGEKASLVIFYKLCGRPHNL